VVAEFAKRHSDAGKPLRSSVVKTTTLTQICEEHALREIHFLKIDVEGHEAEVLDGMDFTRFRPWILVIEATEPNTRTPTHQKWDHLVRDAGYQFVFTDMLNRYYVANEHAELASKFSASAHEYAAERLMQVERRLNEVSATLRDFEYRFNALHELPISAGESAIQDEIKTTLRLLRPYAAKGFKKARFGSANDGGYVHLDDFRGVDTAFSFGVEQNASWDVDVAERGGDGLSVRPHCGCTRYRQPSLDLRQKKDFPRGRTRERDPLVSDQ
jgi:hypothetical protein